MNFRTLLDATFEQKMLRDMKLRVKLCQSCLSYMKAGDKSNEGLYDALSYLAPIEKLNISLNEYDQYTVGQVAHEFDVDFYLYVRNKVEEATKLIDELTVAVRES